MSDLAPFVAASIESKVVEDLKEENDRLRDEIKQLQAEKKETSRVSCRSITFTEGRWVRRNNWRGWNDNFASGLINAAVKTRTYQMQGTRYHDFRIDSFPVRDALPCKISQHRSAEVRLNGVKVATLNDSDSISTKEGTDWDEGVTHHYRFDTGRGTHWSRGFVVEALHASSGDYIPDSENDTVIFNSFTIRNSDFFPEDIFAEYVYG